MAEQRSGRTAMLAKLQQPDPSGRRALMVSTGALAVAMIGLALLCNGLSLASALLTAPGLSVLAAISAAVCGLPYLLVLLWIDRNEPEPAGLVISALAWGAVTATGVSVLFNSLFGVVADATMGDPLAAQQLTASVSAPIVEELSKGFALLLLYAFFRRHVDSVLDGIVYGALVGLGFAVVENWMYYVNSGSVGGVVMLTLMRGVVTSAGTHVSFTALTGAGVGLFRVLRSGALRWAVPPLFLGLAMFVHFCWNTLAGVIMAMMSDNEAVQLLVGLPVAVLVLQVPFIVLVVVMAVLALRHERRIIAAYLADEKAPVVREGELALLVPTRRRAWHLVTLLARGQLRGWWGQRRRFQQLVRLAFEKWHMDREADHDSPDATTHAVRVIELRRALSA